jgi:hypothetical protein
MIVVIFFFVVIPAAIARTNYHDHGFVRAGA